MNVRENLIRRIKDTLAIYAVRIDLDKGEASRAAENFYCGLLNILKGYHLQNMNLEKPNYPAIDLGDAAEGLGVQVTSTATRQKVQDTLDAMFRNGVEQDYPHLVMLITKEWRDSRKAFRMDGVCRFDPNADIWDTNWLLAQLDGIEALEKLEEIRNYLTKHLHLVREPAPALNLPLQSAMAEGAFVGREKELVEIAKRFETEHIVVLSGLGGMGKTELAVKFGREYQESGRGWAYFLHFSGSFGTTLRSNMHRIIPDYSMTGKTDAQIEADALAALNRGGKEDLLVLDNADSGSMTKLRRELSVLRMRVLVTSRQESDNMMELGTLSEEALFGLFRRYGAELEEADMRALIEAVDRHTMTVELMARLLHKDQRKDTLSRLKKALGERDLSSGEFGKTESAYHTSPDQARINEHLKAVFRVADLPKKAQRLLRYGTLIPETGLDSTIFIEGVANRKKKRILNFFLRRQNRRAVTQVEDILYDLVDCGWLMWKEAKLRIHPVIRIVAIEVLKPTDKNCEGFLEGVIRQNIDKGNYLPKEYIQIANLFAEAAEVLKDHDGRWVRTAGMYSLYLVINEGDSLETELISSNQTQAGEASCHENLDDPVDTDNNVVAYREEALQYRQIAVSFLEETTERNDVFVASLYDDLAAAYFDLEKYEKAHNNNLKALEIREKVLPKDHPDIASTYNNVGSTYSALGDYEKALEYLLKALMIREQVLPENHCDIAVSYDNVSATYGALGDHKKELEYDLKALAIWERVLPEDHPDLALSFDNVGNTYGDLGDQQKALEYNLNALEIWERVLPGNHPDLALSCNNIACTYYELGRLEEAATYMRRAADIINRSTLPEHHRDRMDYNKWADRLEREARQARGGE